MQDLGAVFAKFDSHKTAEGHQPAANSVFSEQAVPPSNRHAIEAAERRGHRIGYALLVIALGTYALWAWWPL